MKFYLWISTFFCAPLIFAQSLPKASKLDIPCADSLFQERKLFLKQVEVYEDFTVPDPWAKGRVQFGISFGFNAFFNAPKQYFVTADSTLKQYGKSRGVSGVVSFLVGYKIKPKHSIFLNIPLSDVSDNAAGNIGLFNQKVAGGMGYGYNIDHISIILMVNIMPYERAIEEILAVKKVEQEAYSKFDTSEYPTITACSPSITLGVSYNFLKKYPGMHD